MPGCIALIAAGGRGTRLEGNGGPAGDVPKQYRALAGRPILAHAASAFLDADGVDAVGVVIGAGDRALYDDAVGHLPLLEPVIGGDTRQESVRRGLESHADGGFNTVLIHDCARPLVSREVIRRTLDALASHAGAVPATAVTDSLKRVQDGMIVEAVDRDGLYRAQTPQGFAYDRILEAHRQAANAGRFDYTDDAALAAAAGIDVALVAGSEDNVKITTAQDLALAERMLLGGGESRTGHGLDVHAFAAAGTGPVRLGGIDIPFDRGLAGHSDADAALHAATDAILGALAEGDIGSHFPPTDAAWKDADSAVFLGHAAALLTGRGGSLLNLDLTIVCQAPKIAPHRPAMRARIAEILGTTADRVSVKATTTEGLGALGRGDGIAAEAVATVRLGGQVP